MIDIEDIYTENLPNKYLINHIRKHIPELFTDRHKQLLVLLKGILQCSEVITVGFCVWDRYNLSRSDKLILNDPEHHKAISLDRMDDYITTAEFHTFKEPMDKAIFTYSYPKGCPEETTFMIFPVKIEE